MSDTTAQEPTMEEILASIRRIISEDDAPAEAAAPVEEPPLQVAAEEPLPLVADEEEDGVLELTDRVETMGDLEVYTPPSAEEEADDLAAAAPPVFESTADAGPAPAALSPGERLVGDPAAAAAAAAFGQLSSSILMGNSERTLEDVVRELLRPLLKQWLDDNLPRIVEVTVQEEVERIARNRVR